MIMDALQTFSSAQSLAIAIGTAPSENILDYGIVSGIPSSAQGGGARDMGVGDAPALKLFAQISSAATSGGAGTLAVALQGSVDDGSGGVAGWTTWWSSPVYALATLAVGAQLFSMDFPRPPAGVAVPRFVRLLYTVATADLTGGTIEAGVVLDRPDQMYNSTNNARLGGYQAGINVDN